jgi:hypothetical protein
VGLAGAHAPNHAASIDNPLIVDIDPTLIIALEIFLDSWNQHLTLRTIRLDHAL